MEDYRKLAWLWVLLVPTLAACQSMNPGGSETSPSARSHIRPASKKVEANRANLDQARIDLLRDYQSRVQDESGTTFEEFEAGVYRETESGKYIVDGDTPIDDRKHLEEFFETKIKKMDRATEPGMLIVNTSGGVDTKWSATQKNNLTYCVSTEFGNRYDLSLIHI